MKRILAILLFLLIFPSFSYAKTTRGEVVGWWSLFTEIGYYILYVGEDDSAFVVETSGVDIRNVTVDCKTGEWAIIGENTIVFSWTDNTIQKTTYKNDKLYYHIPESGGMIGMNRENVLTLSNLDVELIP